jgi:hypothetical protein
MDESRGRDIKLNKAHTRRQITHISCVKPKKTKVMETESNGGFGLWG